MTMENAIDRRVNPTPPVRWYCVTLTRWTPDRGMMYKQLVLPAYNAMMAEAQAKSLTPECANAWIHFSCPESGFETQSEAAALIRNTRWYTWP